MSDVQQASWPFPPLPVDAAAAEAAAAHEQRNLYCVFHNPLLIPSLLLFYVLAPAAVVDVATVAAAVPIKPSTSSVTPSSAVEVGRQVVSRNVDAGTKNAVGLLQARNNGLDVIVSGEEGVRGMEEKEVDENEAYERDVKMLEKRKRKGVVCVVL